MNCPERLTRQHWSKCDARCALQPVSKPCLIWIRTLTPRAPASCHSRSHSAPGAATVLVPYGAAASPSGAVSSWFCKYRGHNPTSAPRPSEARRNPAPSETNCTWQCLWRVSQASPRPVPETSRGTRSPHTSPASLPTSVRRLRPQGRQAPKCPVQAGAGASPGDTQARPRGTARGSRGHAGRSPTHESPHHSQESTEGRFPGRRAVNRSRSGLAFSLGALSLGLPGGSIVHSRLQEHNTQLHFSALDGFRGPLWALLTSSLAPQQQKERTFPNFTQIT